MSLFVGISVCCLIALMSPLIILQPNIYVVVIVVYLLVEVARTYLTLL